MRVKIAGAVNILLATIRAAFEIAEALESVTPAIQTTLLVAVRAVIVAVIGVMSFALAV